MEQNNKPGKINALLDTTLSKIRELVENSGAKGEKEPSASLRVVMPDGTNKETENAVREIVLQVIEKYPGVTIV